MKKQLLFCLVIAGATAYGAQPSVTKSEAGLLEKAAAMVDRQPDDALALLNEARADERASAALDYSAANLLARAERYPEAEAAYRAALAKASDFEAAQIGLARVWAMQSRWEEAETGLRPAAQQPDATEEVLLLYGYVLLELQRVITAEHIYRRAALAGGESPDALYGLARCFMAQHRYNECALAMEELVQLRPDQAGYWSLLADAWLAAGQTERAMSRLEAARRLEAITPTMLALLGDLWLNSGQFAEAARAYEEAVTRAPDDAPLTLRAAEGVLLAGDTERAGGLLTAFEQTTDERNDRYYRVRAQWAEHSDQPDVAREAYRAWVQYDPVNEQALLALGDWHYRAEDYEAANMWYERARTAHPQKADAWLRLARVALDREAYALAEQCLERAQVLSGDPGVARALEQVRRLQAVQE